MLRQLVNVAGDELKYAVACSRYRFLAGKQLSKKVLVNGSPKTGTTWMYKLIVSVPGYQHVGNFNGDINRYWQVQPGDVVHGHDPYTEELWHILSAQEIKVILMVRDPRDQAVSRMFHIRRDTNHRWQRSMQAMGDDEALMVCIEGMDGVPGVATMLNLTRSWLKQGDKALCVKYEDMILNTAGQFQHVLQYLGITARPDLIRAAVERNRFERLSVGRKIWKPARKPGQHDQVSHFRKGIVGDWKNYFKAAHNERFKEIAGQTLIELGYEKDLAW